MKILLELEYSDHFKTELVIVTSTEYPDTFYDYVGRHESFDNILNDYLEYNTRDIRKESIRR